jgi:hypothetical protein
VGDAAFDFCGDGLTNHRNFKLVLLAGSYQAGFVQRGNHHVPGALQNELPGVDHRRIDASAQNQRHARVLSGKNLA